MDWNGLPPMLEPEQPLVRFKTRDLNTAIWSKAVLFLSVPVRQMELQSIQEAHLEDLVLLDKVFLIVPMGESSYLVNVFVFLSFFPSANPRREYKQRA